MREVVAIAAAVAVGVPACCWRKAPSVGGRGGEVKKAAAAVRMEASSGGGGGDSKRVALVTGGNRGVGLGIAKALASHRPDVTLVITSRTLPSAEAALPHLNTPAHAHALDVRSDASVAALRDFVVGRYGRLDYLVNNAGVVGEGMDVDAMETDVERFRDTVDTNLTGTLRMLKAFVPLMTSNNYGRVVNVTSGAGTFGNLRNRMAGYCVSKMGVNALTVLFANSAAKDDTNDILINCWTPGLVRTDMTLTDLGMDDTTPHKMGLPGWREPDDAGLEVLSMLDLPKGGPTGKMFRAGKVVSFLDGLTPIEEEALLKM